jgi:putative hydrolase of the HAD superfamily
MASKQIKGIIFDIGRVLVRVDIRRAQQGLAAGLNLTPEELWSAIERDPRWGDWQEGRMSARDWHQNVSNRLGIGMNFEKFKQVWNSALDPEPIHPNSLFAGLTKSYTLGLLSNTDPIHVECLESTYKFFDYFPKSVRTYSCVVGSSKPNPVIYRQALRACKLRADQAVYIDDIATYAEAARGLGMEGIQFRSPEQLRKDLATLGVKTPPGSTA